MGNPLQDHSIYYRAIGNEETVFQAARQLSLPVLLQGPTGCGKSRFVEKMAKLSNSTLVSVTCNEDTSASDLLGRFLIKGGDTIWQDGPVTRAVRTGAILYLDEIAEAREDVVVLLHSLTDHRRELYLDRINETLRAPKEFQLIASYNPGYQRGLKTLKPSTRQRFVGISFSYPSKEIESEILIHETSCTESIASKLTTFAAQLRQMTEMALTETVSTRLLVNAAKLITTSKLDPRIACIAAIAEPLTDDPDTLKSLRDLTSLRF